MSQQLAMTLRRLRKRTGVSLRTVEQKTGISNAYLSQMERGVASRPSPDKLRALAKYYEVEYLDLMNLAGYLPSNIGIDGPKVIAQKAATPASDAPLSASLVDLDEKEEALVMQYVEFLKSRRSSSDRSSSN